MRPGWYPDEDKDVKRIEIKCRWFDRTLLSLATGAIVFAVVILAIRGCNARGQEAPVMLLPEIVYDDSFSINTNTTVIETNGVIRQLTPAEVLKIFPRKRPAQPVVPAIMPRKISRSVSTNDAGERVTVLVERAPEPVPLIHDKPKTNAFWVCCPECKVRAIRTPLRIEVVGSLSVPDGDQIERRLYFKCCNQEFKAKNFKFVETPIAEEIIR